MTSTETRKCLGGCGYTLRSAKAVARGYGARCWAKIRKAQRTADLSAWTPSQIAEAEQAIEDGAVVPSTREGVYHVVSTDGTDVHLVHRDGCNCENGLKTRQPRPCYHRCAIAIVTASATPSASLPSAPVALPGRPPVAADTLSVLAEELSAGGDILPVLTDVWTVLESMGALAGASAPF
ncbi:MAG TPA: hypothetical protein VGG83_07030 [Trebonia sp.]